MGVYPSAFHVAWTAPPELDPRPASGRGRPTIASLAVDVEPVVFWDGREPDPNELLEKWKSKVHFINDWGTVAVGNNGPSGAALVENALTPLSLSPDEVAFTDAVPWFFVKGGAGSQGQAINERFNPIAENMGATTGALPDRPTHARLVKSASEEPRRSSLRAEIVAAKAPLVITLGQEALDAILAVADTCAGVQSRLAATDTYGVRGELVVDGFQAELLPLVHPGFQRQTKDAKWKAQLARWEKSARS